MVGAGLERDAFPGSGSPVAEQALLSVDAQGARCPSFCRASNACRFYAERPFDCRLYPLVLMYDADGAGVLLAADIACPVIERLTHSSELAEYVDGVARLLDSTLIDRAWEVRAIVGEHKPWMEHATALPNLTQRLCRSDLGLRRLTLSTRQRLTPFFTAHPAQLAAHAFAPVRVWAGMFDLRWAVVDGRLLVVASGNGPSFLMLPPLGAGPLEPAVERAAEILSRLNAPHAPIHIQDVDDEIWPAMERMGFQTTRAFQEYVYDRRALVALTGRDYKGKRAARNHFEKHHDVLFRPFEEPDLPACFALYRSWWTDRAAADPTPIFTSQLQASAAMFLVALCEAEALDLRVRVLEADGRIVACTAGYEAPGGEQFVVLLEVTDRQVKGAAAYCYQAFCREMEGFRLINAMSDSGLPAIAAAKELYHPVRRVRSRVVERAGALDPRKPGL